MTGGDPKDDADDELEELREEVLEEARDDVVSYFDGEFPIEIEGLRNSFGEQVIHEDLSLKVKRGEILGVVGGSGTGKSVLMRSIIGLQIPDAGEVRVFGLIVALAGCYQGMQVRGNSEDVGLRTTKAVVQAIFMVIVLDAFFAIFFDQIGWS